MTALPDANDFIAASVVEGGFKTAISDQRSYLAGLFGVDGTQVTARSVLGLSDAAVTTVADIVDQAAIETGTVTAYFQATAPIGWTLITSQNDKLLRVVSGTGGGSSGTWVISGLAVAGHVLTEAEMPSHFHTASIRNTELINPGESAAFSVGSNTSSSQNTSSVGGDLPHTHGITSDGTWRPEVVDMILCSKDAP